MTSKLALGVDIGGTKISITVGDASAKILAERVLPTRTGVQTKRAIQEMIQGIKTLAQDPRFRGKIRGIGFGIPGPIDDAGGTIPFSPNLKGWKGIPLKRLLKKEINLPVCMANDANAAALGEKVYGEGRRLSDFIYMTVSTGIGGGIVTGGKLLEGASFVAGEVGHMSIVAEGELCGCGRKGCLEAYGSGTAIARYAEKSLSRTEKNAILKAFPGEKLDAKTLGIAAKLGNPASLRIYERAGFYLGLGIANLLNILNPQSVILGGGVWKSSPSQFWKTMMASCEKHAWPEAFNTVQIVPSKLGGRVGDLGALALVFEHL